MKYLMYICLALFMIIFTACSSKVDVNIKNDTTIKQETINSDAFEEDEFLSEFEDELEIEEKSDPFSGYNRIMTGFNDGLFEYILAPVAKGYAFVFHKEIRLSVDNFFHNILFPVRLVNNVLQGKFQNSADETGRFVINSTVGILGLFDPAKSYFKIEPHNEDFGQTLGFYGVGSGPHIVLPFLGPSNLRDLVSLYPDSYASPISYDKQRGYNLTHNYGESLVLKVYDRINFVSLHEGEYENLKKDAVDLYPYLRDIYEQYREKQIKE